MSWFVELHQLDLKYTDKRLLSDCLSTQAEKLQGKGKKTDIVIFIPQNSSLYHCRNRLENHFSHWNIFSVLCFLLCTFLIFRGLLMFSEGVCDTVLLFYSLEIKNHPFTHHLFRKNSSTLDCSIGCNFTKTKSWIVL